MPYGDSETLPRAELQRLQSERLQETVHRVYENVEFYRELFEANDIDPETIRTTGDLTKLPFTTKEDFADHYPDGLLAVERSDVERIQASSGTSGTPKIAAYTANDVALWQELEARSLYAAGVREDHYFHQAIPYGLFTGGFGKHFGLQELGATEVPIGPAGSEKQLAFLEDFESESGVLLPSYALYLAERAEELGIDPHKLPLSNIIIGAEMTTEPLRNEVEAAWGADATNNYGLTELLGPGVAAECQTGKDGLHIWEDHFFAEVIDPITGERLRHGEEGELVLTSLTKEAVPVLRYRTGDITSLYDPAESCTCGRTHQRMSYITGRSDDLLIVRGVNLYPSEIEHALLEVDEVGPHYRIDLWKERNLDRIKISVEHAVDYDGDPAALEGPLRDRLDRVLSLTPDELAVKPPNSIERNTTGKVKRVFDAR